jgi:hypothetical protein
MRLPGTGEGVARLVAVSRVKVLTASILAARAVYQLSWFTLPGLFRHSHSAGDGRWERIAAIGVLKRRG